MRNSKQVCSRLPGQPGPDSHPFCLLPQENSDTFLLAVDTDWKVGLSSQPPDMGDWQLASPSAWSQRRVTQFHVPGAAGSTPPSLQDHPHCSQWICLPPAQ